MSASPSHLLASSLGPRASKLASDGLRLRITRRITCRILLRILLAVAVVHVVVRAAAPLIHSCLLRLRGVLSRASCRAPHRGFWQQAFKRSAAAAALQRLHHVAYEAAVAQCLRVKRLGVEKRHHVDSLTDRSGRPHVPGGPRLA